jgi:hypothetical protein
MKKKIFMLSLIAILSFAVSSNVMAASNSWNLYGQDSDCTTCMYVSSQGDIYTNHLGYSATFDGWATTVWNGGYGAGLKLKVQAELDVDGFTNNHSKTITDTYPTYQNGASNLYNSIEIDEKFGQTQNIFSATVDAQGWVWDEDGYFYYHAYGDGDHGLD